jgi:hypothetical protein
LSFSSGHTAQSSQCWKGELRIRKRKGERCEKGGERKGKREEGRGKREEGRGKRKREEGRGKREEGRGKREEGRGKREEGRKREAGKSEIGSDISRRGGEIGKSEPFSFQQESVFFYHNELG